MKKSVAAAAIAGSMLVGGGIGVALFAPGLAGADTTPTTTAPSPGSAATPAAPGVTNQGNEDATHEAGESKAREDAEKNGTAFGPGGPHAPGMHGSDETDAHEKAEDPAREAQENANKAATTTTTTAPA